MGAIGRLVSFNSKPTINTTSEVGFVIHGFERSENNQIITEEVCQENLHTLINKPLLVDYKYTGESLTDSFGDHAVTIKTNRDTGEDMIVTETVPIGVFTRVEIGEVEGQRVAIGYATLWTDRFYNAVSLLYQMFSEGIKVKCSCEYIFINYEMKEGVQLIKSPIEYEGHCILNSDANRGVGIVDPAYKESHVMSFNQAILTDLHSLNNNKKEEGGGDLSEVLAVESVEEQEPVVVEEPVAEEKPATEELIVEEAVETEEEPTEELAVEEPVETEEEDTTEEQEEKELNDKSFNEKSLVEVQEDKVEKLRDDLTKRLKEVFNTNDLYISMWNIYKDYFVFEKYDEVDGQYKSYKCSFTHNEMGELVLGEEKVEVERETIWVEVEKLQQSLNQIEALTQEKVELSEQVVALNTQIQELMPFKEKIEKMEYDEKLEEVTHLYGEKFSALNAMDKFHEEATQTLLKEVLIEEKSLNAKAQLADILLGQLHTETKVESKKEEAPVVKEVCSKKTENLIPNVSKKYANCGLNL